MFQGSLQGELGCIISLFKKLSAGGGVGFVMRMAWSRPSAALGVSTQCEMLCI